MAGYLQDDPYTGNAILLKMLQTGRASELRHNLENRGRNFMTGGTPGDLAELESDISSDPDTGDAAEAATALRTKQLADEAAFLSPGAQEVRDVKQQDALARLFAQHTEPVVQGGRNAMDLERLKQEGESRMLDQQHDFTRELVGGNAPNELGGTGFTPSIGANGQVTFRGNAPKKPTTEEQRALDTMASLSALGPELLQRYEAQYPGIASNPTDYAGLGGMLKGAASGAAYKMGFMNDTSADQLTQLTGYLEAVLPRMLSSGRINREQYTDLKMHVPQVGLSAGANYQRAKYVLDQILPHVRAAVGTPMGGGDPYADPNYQPR